MAHLESLILYDPQERSREALQFGFERDGYKVYGTGESDDALAMAQTKVAQLVVACIPLAHHADDDWEGDALELVGSLREEAATRELPIVVLGERGAREQSLRAGADEFISRPAFIRDVLTLSSLAVALRQDGDEDGVAGMLQDYELYFLVRALSVAERTGSIEIDRDHRTGEVHFVKGEVVTSRCGRMNGLPAFLHLLLWGEATIHLRMTPPSAERKLSMSTEELLEKGAQFAREFEALASRIGGGMAVFRSEPRRAAEARAQIPAEVMTLLKHFDGKRPFIDVVEDSSFKPLDTIKIAWRLQQLGVIVRVKEPGGPATLSSQLAVRDWLLGAPAPEDEAARTTVTEAGRRAAEAFHSQHEARTDSPPADELLDDDTQRVFTMTAAADDDDVQHELEPPPVAEKKKRQRTKSYPTGRLQRERKPKPVGLELRPSQPEPKRPLPTDIDETIPFSKFEMLDLPEVSEKKLQPKPVASPVHESKPAPAKPAPVAAKPAPAPVAAKPAPAPVAAKPAPVAAKPAPVAAMPAPVGKSPPAKQGKQKQTAKELHFSAAEEEFFARESELYKVGPVETFDDLEPSQDTSPKRKGWFGGGDKNEKFGGPALPKTPPRKR